MSNEETFGWHYPCEGCAKSCEVGIYRIQNSMGTITFDMPLKASIYILDDEPDTAEIFVDFGMSYNTAVTKERNFLYNYMNDNEEADPLRTAINTLKFDIMHAFFHCSEDPNYGTLHWALYGNLKDRAKVVDADCEVCGS